MQECLSGTHWENTKSRRFTLSCKLSIFSTTSQERTMELIVVGFQGRYRAAQVLTDLRQRGVHLFDLDQAIIVSWEDRRNFIVQQSINLSREEGSRWARLWGAFIKLTLFQPFTERLSSAASKVSGDETASTNGDSLGRDWWVADVGIPESFVR